MLFDREPLSPNPARLDGSRNPILVGDGTLFEPSYTADEQVERAGKHHNAPILPARPVCAESPGPRQSRPEWDQSLKLSLANEMVA